MNYSDPALNMLLFDNNLKSSNAYSVNSTDGILWRRDEVRLVAYKLKNKVKGEYSYKTSDLSYDENTTGLKMTTDGKISLVNDDGGTNELKEIQNSISNRQLLQVLKSEDESLKISIQTKFLTRQLVTNSRKLKKEKIDTKKVEVVLDVKEGTFYISELGQKKELPFRIEKNNGSINFVRYAFPLFMQMFIDSRKFGAEVEIVIPNSMYSIVKFNSQLTAVLTHKKD